MTQKLWDRLLTGGRESFPKVLEPSSWLILDYGPIPIESTGLLMSGTIIDVESVILCMS